jgi:hypothetical protein
MKIQTKVGIAALSGFLLTACSTATGTNPAGWFSSTHPVVIPAGTMVSVRTQATLSSRDTRSGQTVPGTLAAPLVINGLTLAPVGSGATLLIADSDAGGRVKGKARLGVRLTAMQVAGALMPVDSSVSWHEARATKKKDAAKIGILSGIGAAIGAIGGGGKGAAIGAGAGGGAGTALVLSTRGDPAVIPAESVLQFRLEQPITVNVK